MTREPRRGEWMMPLLSDFPGASGEALRILQEAPPADRWLLVRRLAEYEIRRHPGDQIDDQVFRLAARQLRAQGDYDGARTMDAIAATSGDLDNADLDWKHRYDGRPPATAELAAVDLLATGRIQPCGPGQVTGIDGAAYQAATLDWQSGDPVPAVIAITHAGTLEIISGFRDPADRDRWLADRQSGRAAPTAWPPAGKPGPLSGAVTGPGCRAQREERVLAWLLQHDGPAGEALRLLQPRAFSTYARCEIHLAWQQAAATAAQAGGAAPPPGEVRHQLARRLLRAPAWADHAVGWPLGHHALAYHDRLAATPITAPQAESAARTLLQEDTTPADQAPEATVAPSRPARSARPGQAQSAQPGPRAPAPRRPGDPMPPTGPRM